MRSASVQAYYATVVISWLAFVGTVLTTAFVGVYRHDKEKRWSANAAYATSFTTMFVAFIYAMYMALLPKMLKSSHESLTFAGGARPSPLHRHGGRYPAQGFVRTRAGWQAGPVA